jgi:hypothetical protein
MEVRGRRERKRGEEIKRERETLSESTILSTVYFYLLGNCVASQDVTIFQE